MLKFTQREIVLFLATFFVCLYAGSLMLAKPKFDMVRDLSEKQADLKWQIDRDRQLVGKKDKLTQRFEELSKMLPPAMNEDMGVYWQQMLEQLSRKNNVQIINSKAGLEKKLGDVSELPIECKTWEGDLDGITHFLFDLQSEGAMLDIRKLGIRSKDDNRGLRGSFTLYCAYTRMPEQGGGSHTEGEQGSK